MGPCLNSLNRAFFLVGLQIVFIIHGLAEKQSSETAILELQGIQMVQLALKKRFLVKNCTDSNGFHRSIVCAHRSRRSMYI